ncbi:PREDICTED: transcription factor 21-like [Branchiostoma belcheri]|uniref:Transcription factor 21-like n=1 Tax=Branchiostoma belcheri TaxID=7741 RepID=A0A6P5ASB2_BRABE|nr:PREDICTED: transcription factor 21-like [Branchiostoma belcheri]
MAYATADFFGTDAGLSSLLRPDTPVTSADRDGSDSSLPSFEDSGLSSGGSPEGSALLSGGSRRRRRRRKPRLTGLSKQRQAANERERVRMQNLTAALGVLREHIPPPVAPKDKRLSKIETLKLAIGYIDYLRKVLQESAENASSLLPPSLESLAKEDAEFDIHGSFQIKGQNKEQKCRRKDRNRRPSLSTPDCHAKKSQLTKAGSRPTAAKVQLRPPPVSPYCPKPGSQDEVSVKLET